MRDIRHQQFTGEFVRGQDRVYGFIASLVPNRTDAEEIFQQTLLVLWRKWDQFEPGTNFVSWACTIAHYEVNNYLRQAHRRTATLSSDVVELLVKERQQITGELDDRRSALRECVDRLPQNQRTLIEQAYSGVSTIAELADQLGQTANALYLTLRRIRQALVDCINRRLGGEAR